MNYERKWIEAESLFGIELSLLRRLINNAPKTSINLGLGELAFPFPAELAEQARRILIDARPAYTANAGIPELREKVSDRYDDAKLEEICITNGAEEALYIALHAIINQGDLVAIVDPDYPAYPALAKLAGARVIRLPLEEGFTGINFDRWEKLLAGVKVVILSNPSNPCGFCFNSESFSRFCDILNRLDVILIVDEIYSDLFIKTIYSLDYKILKRCIVVGGLSKSHLMSGWRIGWIYSDREFIDIATKLKQYISTCSPWLSQELALFALGQEHIPASNRVKLSYNQDLVKSFLEDKTLHIPPAGPYIMIKVHDSLEAAEQYLQKGVITAPGISFGLSCKEWIRINIAHEEEKLLGALKRLQ